MQQSGLYSVQDIWQMILALCAAIITVAGALNVIFKGINKAKEPTSKIISRIDEHDKRLNEHDDRLDKVNEILGRDKKAIEEINESSRVTQKALLAILEQLMTGDSLEKLKEAKKELEHFLINK